MNAPPTNWNMWSRILGDAKIESDPFGDNKTFAISAEDGQQYILKPVQPDTRDVSIDEEYQVQRHLAQSGVPVAPFITTDRGSVSAELDGKTYILMKRLSNDPVVPEQGSDAKQSCARIGAAIGTLSFALDQYPWTITSFTHDIAHQTFHVRYPGLPSDLQHFLEPRIQEAIDALSDIPMQRIHGDCNPGNVLLHRTESGIEVSGFIDIDHLPMGQRIYDLAYYIAYRCRQYARSPVTNTQSERFAELIAAYVSGYTAANPLTTRELEGMLPAILSAEITSTAWSYLILTEWTHLDRTGQQEGYEQGCQSLRWLVANYDRLSSTLGRVAGA